MSFNDRMGQGVLGSDAANFYDVHLDIADLSADTSYFIPVAFNSVFRGMVASVDGAILTADAVITPKNSAGTAITNGALTLTQAGSAAGSTFRNLNFAAPANDRFLTGDKIELAVTGAGAGGTPRCHVAILMERLG